MVINAMNSGATQFMADFEDSHAPTWSNNLDGHINLRDALRRTISFAAPNGGEGVSSAHQALGWFKAALLAVGKMWAVMVLWNDVFCVAQDLLAIPRGTVRATVLIETLLASFEMEEILYELREHSSGLNCGRWDYIFSFIKKLRNHPQFLLPDRSDVGMTSPFMAAYVALLIQTCHKRGVHAMGGMAAQIPIKDNKAANDAAMLKLHVRREEVKVTAADLLSLKGISGGITEKIWQWVRHSARTSEGKVVTADWVAQLLQDELATKRSALGPERYARSKYELAGKLIATTIQGREYSDFLTTLCYDHILTLTGSAKL
ncbi:malate synthase, partial [Haematococcus lacustris]